MNNESIYHRAAAIISIALLALMIWDAGWNNSDWFVVLLVIFIAHLLIELMVILFAQRTVTRIVHKQVEVNPIIAEKKTEVEAGPFRYNDYTLYRNMTKDAAGGKRYFYFFAKKTPKAGEPCAKPSGYHVGVNKITGLPFLKSGAGPDGEVLKEAQPFKPDQCQALTGDGKQCKNSNRQGSRYCATHKGYRPPAADKVNLSKTDTKPKSSKAKDTLPSVRKAPAKASKN